MRLGAVTHQQRTRTVTTKKFPFAGETLTYGIAGTAIGLALVAASGRGVTAILLGDDRARLRREAAVALAGARLEERTAEMQPVLDAVAATVERPDRGLTLAF